MKILKRSLIASSIIASFVGAPTAFGDDITARISDSLLDTYTDKYEEADLVSSKLSDIRLAAMSYWSANQAYPNVINELVSDSFYFGTFTTTFGTQIAGTNNTNSYALTIDLPSPELASYVASSVNGTFSGNRVTLEFGLPMSAVANNTSLSRFADPANPDLNRMDTAIDMNGNNIDNVGTLTANSATVNGDLIVNSGDNTLSMTTTGLSYNGAEVITSDNIGTYSAGADAVLKTEDAIMNGAYTIQGVGSAINIANDSRINIQGDEVSTFIEGNRRGIVIGQGSRSLLEIGDGPYGSGLVFNKAQGTADVSLYAGRFGNKSSLLMEQNVQFKSSGGNMWIGASDGRIIAFGGAARTVNLAAKDTDGEVNIIVGQNGYQKPDYALRAANDDNRNAFVSLMYQSDAKLTTDANGVTINGAITSGNVNISDTNFVYQGSEVLTSGNFMTYAADANDVVSKTQDGTLRGLYTIDGLEADGSSPSGAGLNFINGSTINHNGRTALSFNESNTSFQPGVKTSIKGTIEALDVDNNPYFSVGNDLFFRARQIGDAGIELKSTTNNHGVQSFGQLALDINGGGGAVLKHTGGSTNIGATDDRFGSFGGGSSSVNLYASDSIKLKVYNGGFGSDNVNEVLVGTRDSSNGAYVGLLYQDEERLRTTSNGVIVTGNISTQIDNGDGTFSEVLNVSDTAFTYKGSDVITTDNLSVYVDNTDLVSKTQDGTLRGLYTIDGLEADGVSQSGAGLKFVNGAYIDTNLLVKSADVDLLDVSAGRIDIATRYSGHNTGIYISAMNDAVKRSILNLGRFNAKLFAENGTTIIGAVDTRINAFEGSSNQVFIGARDEVKIGVQNSGSLTNNTVFRAYSDILGRSVVDLEYEAQKRLSTNADGVDIAGNFVASYDSDANGVADTEYLRIDEAAFIYNGSDVITAANIDSFVSGDPDAVKKNENGTLRGQYTIDGKLENGTTNSNARMSFVNNSRLYFDDIYLYAQGGRLSVQGNTVLYGTNATTGGKSSILSDGTSATLKLEQNNTFSKISAGNNLAILQTNKSGVGTTNVKTSTTALELNQFGGTTNTSKITLSQGTGVDLRSTSRSNSADKSILKLKEGTTTLSAPNILLSGTNFTYNGDEVITAGNIGTYLTSVASDAVSKTENGTLRGLYTIDGLEDDGVTNSNAGLAFLNGAGVRSTFEVKINGDEVVRANRNIVRLTTHVTNADTGIYLNAASNGFRSILDLKRDKAVLSSGSGQVFIGAEDKRINAFSRGAENVFIGASNVVEIGVQDSGVSQTNTVLTAYSDASGRSAIDLEYESMKRLSTNFDGIDIGGNFVASYDSDADGVADTEYLRIDENAFTYNGSDVITSANIGTYMGGASNAVLKDEDGTLTGKYTIDGSTAGLELINGSSINIIGSNGLAFNATDNQLSATVDFVNLVANNSGGQLSLSSFGSAQLSGKSSVSVTAGFDAGFGVINTPTNQESYLVTTRDFFKAQYSDGTTTNALNINSNGFAFSNGTSGSAGVTDFIKINQVGSGTSATNVISSPGNIALRGNLLTSVSSEFYTDIYGTTGVRIHASDANSKYIDVSQNGVKLFSNQDVDVEGLFTYIRADNTVFIGTDTNNSNDSRDIFIGSTNLLSAESLNVDISATNILDLNGSSVNLVSDAVKVVDSTNQEVFGFERVGTDASVLFSYGDKPNGLSFNNTTKVWATNAEINASRIITNALEATNVTADVVNAREFLFVDGIDVAQWIRDCEAGVSQGCSGSGPLN